MHPTQSIAELEAEAKRPERRDRARASARSTSCTAVPPRPRPDSPRGSRPWPGAQLDGVWLSSIVLGSGDGRLAMQGGTSDPRLVPVYLAALAAEHALAGVRFDQIALRRAEPADAPARMVFRARMHRASSSAPARAPDERARQHLRPGSAPARALRRARGTRARDDFRRRRGGGVFQLAVAAHGSAAGARPAGRAASRRRHANT